MANPEIDLFDSVSLLWAAGGCGLVTAASAAAGCFAARGSTGVPAGGWALAASLFFTLEVALRLAGGLSEPALAAIRLAVAAVAVCPTMALLGAKRPQHGVWQLIVATLAVVLALPAATATLIRPDGFPAPHPLERWFLPLLVLIGWMNFMGTRRTFAATAIAVGQLAILRPYLPGLVVETAVPQPAIDLAGAASVACGSLVALAQAVRAGSRTVSWNVVPPTDGRSGQKKGVSEEITRPFLALRETLGAAWALRMAERFDALAIQRRWPCRLSFHGLSVEAAPGSDGWERDAIRAAEAIFSRFASRNWLMRHRFSGDRRGLPGIDGEGRRGSAEAG
jgi:hypothetical protein